MKGLRLSLCLLAPLCLSAHCGRRRETCNGVEVTADRSLELSLAEGRTNLLVWNCGPSLVEVRVDGPEGVVEQFALEDGFGRNLPYDARMTRLLVTTAGRALVGYWVVLPPPPGEHAGPGAPARSSGQSPRTP